jgi:hypothetical protein
MILVASSGLWLPQVDYDLKLIMGAGLLQQGSQRWHPRLHMMLAIEEFDE